MVTSARERGDSHVSSLGHCGDDHLGRDKVTKTRVLIFEISVVLKFLISEKIENCLKCSWLYVSCLKCSWLYVSCLVGNGVLVDHPDGMFGMVRPDGGLG